MLKNISTHSFFKNKNRRLLKLSSNKADKPAIKFSWFTEPGQYTIKSLNKQVW